MAEQKSGNRWSWDVAGFEPSKKPSENEDYYHKPAPLVRRYSMAASSILPHSFNSKLLKLKDNIKHVREDYTELRQEAVDLQEYSNAKLDRLTRYLSVLADKSRKLDQAVLDTEARISPLVCEKKKLFNDLLTAKGNIKVFCRARPLFEDEGSSIVEFPDEHTIRVNTGDDIAANSKKDFEFDRVYGPHVSQAELFTDVQPFVQSAFDGFNVLMLAYGQSKSGKTYTMEGSSHDRGLYARCFEELFDLSNSDTTATMQFNFSVSAFELYNEQVRDLLSERVTGLPKVQVGSADFYSELVQEKVENPIEFSRVLKAAIHNRGDPLKFDVSHLIISIHIYYSNLITGENLYSKLSLADLAGSDCSSEDDNNGERVTDLLHAMRSLSALGDVLASLTSKKETVPYENSMLTKVLADSLGGSSKTLMIVNVNPNAVNVSETLQSLNFASRARNSVSCLGNRDTIKKWRDIANDARKALYEKEVEVNKLKQDVLAGQHALKHANDQCVLLFNEVQKAWKVSFTLQSDLKSENIMLSDNYKIEQDQNAQLRSQVAQLLQSEQDHKTQIRQRDSTIENLQVKLKSMESQLNEALHSRDLRSTNGAEAKAASPNITGDSTASSAVTKKLEEELLKRDVLIERLHEENERLFDRLTGKANSAALPQLASFSPKETARDAGRNDTNNIKGGSIDVTSSPLAPEKIESAISVVKSGTEKVKTTPAGEYLTSALNEFDPEQYDSLAALSDGANKLLMLVLAAVIKAGASREHEILAEIRDAVFAFIRKLEPKRVMDTMLVSRVRILYIRSLLARSPELQSIKVPSVDRFLEKPNSGRSRSSSRGSSPGRSPVRHDSGSRNSLVVDQIHGFKVNIKPEKKSKLSSVVLKIRGIDQDTGRHVTGVKLREITEDAKSYAVGNRALAALFVHTPAGELQRQIRNWLGENLDFLSVTSDTVGGATSQLELLSTAIMDGWMAGLGAAQPPKTDALGQLLFEYAKRVYNSQLQHLKDIAGTLASEVAEDSAQVAKLRSALESVDHKRRKILVQMKSDAALLTLEDGGSPVRNPSTAAEDARLASLVSLDGVLKQSKDIIRQSSVSSLSRSKKRALLLALDELGDRMPSLLELDHPCARKHIAEARKTVQAVAEEEDRFQDSVNTKLSAEAGSAVESDVAQWNVLQFNTGSTTPFIIKCGANSNSELVIKAEARVQEPKGGEIVRVVPRPTALEDMDLEEMKVLFNQLPESLSLLALARTADGTRARYSRLYRTLAMKVPALRELVSELEKGVCSKM